MIFAHHAEPPIDEPQPADPFPSGETRAYCEWIEREVAPRPDDERYVESHASLDCDDEDTAWSALLAHARALAFRTREADEWDAVLADFDG